MLREVTIILYANETTGMMPTDLFHTSPVTVSDKLPGPWLCGPLYNL